MEGGGPGPLSSVVALDLGAHYRHWEEKAPMPTARYDLAVASSGTKLFAVGGRGQQLRGQGCTLDAASRACRIEGVVVGTIIDTLEIYESATDRWSTAAPMPTRRYGLAAAIVGNTLFALGGKDDYYHDGNPLCYDVTEAYDIEGGSWSAAEPMGTPRNGLAAVAGP